MESVRPITAIAASQLFSQARGTQPWCHGWVPTPLWRANQQCPLVYSIISTRAVIRVPSYISNDCPSTSHSWGASSTRNLARPTEGLPWVEGAVSNSITTLQPDSRHRGSLGNLAAVEYQVPVKISLLPPSSTGVQCTLQRWLTGFISRHPLLLWRVDLVQRRSPDRFHHTYPSFASCCSDRVPGNAQKQLGTVHL